MPSLRILTRRETIGDAERLHVARAYPGAGAFYWTSLYRIGGVVVDSGIRPARAEVARFLDEKPAEALLATHEHEDHVGNFALAAPRAIPAFAPRAAVDLLERVASGRTARLPLYRAITWGGHDGARGVRVANGDVKAGGRTIRLVPTPGHSADHVALLDEASGALFTGDAVLGKLKASRPPENVPEQMESLRRMIALAPRVVLPAHGPALTRPREQIGSVLEYLEDLQRRAHALAARGKAPRRIARELLGREGAMTWASFREFSKENLVRSLLSRAP